METQRKTRKANLAILRCAMCLSLVGMIIFAIIAIGTDMFPVYLILVTGIGAINLLFIFLAREVNDTYTPSAEPDNSSKATSTGINKKVMCGGAIVIAAIFVVFIVLELLKNA
jgi:hypothetical protein